MALNSKSVLIKILLFFWKIFRVPSAYSWQTFVWLSLFSWIMSILATGFSDALLENFGLIFLIIGVTWAAKANSLVIGPWITGILVSIFIFGLFTDDTPEAALVAWPIISAAIAAIPYFFNQSHQFSPPNPQERQKLVILFGSQFLVSCWIQFAFVTQTWLEQYPTFLADDLSQSHFVVVFNPRQRGIPRGVILLDLMAGFVQRQLEGKPWPEVERWLIEEARQERIDQLKEKIIEQSPLPENELWEFDSEATQLPSGYNLHLLARWKGVSPQEQAHYVEKTCAIVKATLPQTAILEQEVATVRCEPANIYGWGQNPIPHETPSIISPSP